jgi:DNA-binding CsgD family transcriptional regulator
MLDLHKLLPVAYRAAAQVLHSPVLAQEAGERALHKRTQSLGQEELQQRPAPFRVPRGNGADQVRERLEPRLTPRQRDVVQAVLSCNSTSAAAQSCGMRPRDLRRHLRAITRKARQAFAADPLDDGFADDPVVQFRLPR